MPLPSDLAGALKVALVRLRNKLEDSQDPEDRKAFGYAGDLIQDMDQGLVRSPAAAEFLINLLCTVDDSEIDMTYEAASTHIINGILP